MPLYTSDALFDFSKTIAHALFETTKWPWEPLHSIESFILKTGPSLDPGKFTQTGENIWIAASAKIAPSASISGPCIIDENAEIRHCAFIRGNAIVGKNTVVGNSTEIKNSILFDFVQVPHFNYVGDSILGYRSHMGAGSITSNVKSDKTLVVIKSEEGGMDTGRKKVGVLMGDYVEIGCNTVLNPGTVIGRHCIVYPTSSVRGTIPENSIYKSQEKIVPKEMEV